MRDERGTHSVGRRVHPRASSLLRAKLRPPPKPNHYVRRARLLELLDATAAASVIVVVSPAGSGKTSLLSGWLDERAASAAWLALDEGDRDGVQFWRGVLAAIGSVRPHSCERASALLQQGTDLGDVVTQLLDDLDSTPAETLLLVIDDVHLVDSDDSIAASLELFVRYLPTWLHVALLSRREPSIHLDRLRARGHVGDIRFEQLQFAQHEAVDMLSQLVPSLPRKKVAAAAAQAGGWAAGLQLAALAARGSHAREGNASQALERDLLIEDYVWREVLAREDPSVVETLIDVSVVERVNASLANALMARGDAGKLLLEAEARGLFVRRLQEGWFEVHSVVRSVLLDELSTRPEHAAELHERAARWFEAAGEVPLALEHWLLANRPRDALRRLSASVAELYDSGREAVIRRTIAAVPRATASADPETMIEFAWSHLLVSRARFFEWLDQLNWSVEQGSVELPLAGRITMLRSIAATMTGDWAAAAPLARMAMQQLGDNWSRDPVGCFGWNMVASDIALSESWNDNLHDVQEAQHAVRGDHVRRIAFESTRALGEVLAGNPVDALRVAAGVRRAASVTNRTILRTELGIAEAMAHRELGDRARAVTELTAIAAHPVEPLVYLQLLALLELVAMHIDDGDLTAAEQRFGEASALVADELRGAGAREWLARTGISLTLAVGDQHGARYWSEQIADPFWAGVGVARVALAGGDRAAAVSAVDATGSRCIRHEAIRELLLCRAVDDRDEAMKHATMAVELASTHGLLQTIASEDAETLELVERAAWRAPPEWLDRLRRAAGSGSVVRQRPRALGAALTERERDVLRFLPSRLTYREIASELYVSLNTLKFHLKIIYRKLGVGSRAEAAEIARQLALIPTHR